MIIIIDKAEVVANRVIHSAELEDLDFEDILNSRGQIPFKTACDAKLIILTDAANNVWRCFKDYDGVIDTPSEYSIDVLPSYVHEWLTQHHSNIKRELNGEGS